jgi:hypothetical protein
LNKEDSKIACCWDAKTGQIVKNFGPISQNITSLNCTKERLIVEDSEQNLSIWNIENSSQLTVIPCLKGYSQSVLGITDDKLTLLTSFVEEDNQSDHDETLMGMNLSQIDKN